MCGVFGIIGDYSPSKAREALKRLAHRGRDYCGIVEGEKFFLAHQRLPITDAHPRSHQPMRRDRLLIIYADEWETLNGKLELKLHLLEGLNSGTIFCNASIVLSLTTSSFISFFNSSIE